MLIWSFIRCRAACSLLKAVLIVACTAFASLPAVSAELLLNRSFEAPVAPNNGNNFYSTLPNWSVVSIPFNSIAVNLVVPHPGYANNPQVTPVGGGRQYFDINAAGGTISQTVTIPSNGFASISAWFSLRDGLRDLSAGSVQLRNSSNLIVASQSISFSTADPVSSWKQASTSTFAVPAGTYTFEVVMDNFHNTDLASLDFVPANYALEIGKSADKTGPLTLGEVITYTYVVKNTGNWALTNVNVADVHGGSGVPPVPGSEALVTDVAPLGDTSDPAITTPSAADGNWNTLGPGDTVRFSATYTMTQTDVDLLQ
jgi:uncharacterized repeat protein (TIGR01451 family)